MIGNIIMKLRELLQQLGTTSRQIGVPPVFICGGVPRDKYMKHLDNIADLDLTNGSKTVNYLSQQFYEELRKKYNVTRKTSDDGHSTIFIGTLKMDFSSNFMVHNIDHILKQMMIEHPTNMQREMYSRDLTCNALLMTLDLKKILDPTGRGFKDIEERKIRTCLAPDITLTSNRNRVIRIIYLACKLSFDVDASIISYVKNNPQAASISTEKVMKEKIDKAFEYDPDRANYLITQMNLWGHIPITKVVYPYYMKYTGKYK